jgi:hypothetical protein
VTRGAVCVLFLPLLNACAAAAMEPAKLAPAPAAPAPAAVSVMAPPPPPPIIQERQPGGALADVVHAEQDLMASIGSCVAACRALGSMDSATGRLCRLAATNEEQRECTESKSKVIASRARVAASCGSCPGTSVDPNAPIPSP